MADRPSGRANRDFLQIIVNKKIAQQRALPSQYARDIAGGSPARGEAEAGASGIDRDPRLDYMTFTPLFGWSNAPQDSVYQVGSSLGDVPAQLSKLPKYISDAIAAAGGSWHITDNRIGESEAFTKDPYADMPVKGWENTKYKDLPGVYQPREKAIIISSDPDEPDGSFAMALHESGHGYDDVVDRISQTPEFRSAYNADKSNLPPYYNQPEEAASLREAFAESFARYYAADPAFNANGTE